MLRHPSQVWQSHVNTHNVTYTLDLILTDGFTSPVCGDIHGQYVCLTVLAGFTIQRDSDIYET